jgi:hypothetical protein
MEFANGTAVPNEIAFVSTTGVNPRNGIRYSKNVVYGYYLKLGYRFSNLEEYESTLFYTLVHVSICGEQIYRSGLSYNILNDGTTTKLPMMEMLDEHHQ